MSPSSATLLGGGVLAASSPLVGVFPPGLRLSLVLLDSLRHGYNRGLLLGLLLGGLLGGVFNDNRQLSRSLAGDVA